MRRAKKCARGEQLTRLKTLLVGSASALLLLWFAASASQAADAQASNESAAQTMARLIKQTQRDACDGEQLELSCSEDYVLEVLAVEYTILAENHQQQQQENVKDTKVSNKSTLADDGQQKHVCRPLTPLSLPLTSNANGTGAVCDQRQMEAADKVARRREISALVRNECRARKACALDFRWPPMEPFNPGQPLLAHESSARNEPQLNLTRLFNEPCPMNRKLIEIVHRCKPNKVTRRTMCRGGQLQLDCPTDKRLVLVAAEFGVWTNDSRVHERCANLAHQRGEISSLTLAGPSKSCAARPPQVYDVLQKACQLERSCQVEVQPQVLGESNCTQEFAPLEAIKVQFSCLNESMLLPGSIKSPTSTTLNPPTTTKEQPATTPTSTTGITDSAPKRLSFTSPPESSTYATSNNLLLAQQQQLTTSPAPFIQRHAPVAAQQQPQHTLMASTSDTAQQLDEEIAQGPQQEVPSIHVFSIAPDRRPDPTSPVHWSAVQKVRFLATRYQSHIVGIGLCVVTILVLTVALKVSCGLVRSTQDSRNSTTSSKDSACSSAGFKSLIGNGAPSGNGSSSSSAGAHSSHASGGANLKHNSCGSESCFSLDDYNLNGFGAGCGQGSSANSPALNATPLDNESAPSDFPTNANINHHHHHHHHSQPQQHHYQPQLQHHTTVRPKLWTVYNGVEPHSAGNHSSSFRLQHHSSAAAAATMRATRTFVSQQQQQMRSMQRACAAPQLPGARLTNAATDLLLAMTTSTNGASAGAGSFQPLPLGMQQGAPEWQQSGAAANAHDEALALDYSQTQQTAVGEDQLALLVPAGFNQHQLSNQAEAHCPFHQAQQQQQFNHHHHHHQPQQQQQPQHLLFPAQTVQLELPQPPNLLTPTNEQT